MLNVINILLSWHVFLFVLLIVGRKQGLFTIISVIVNATLLSIALDIYVNNVNTNLLWICGITVIDFSVTPMLLVNGWNQKSYVAIIATLLGTFLSLCIAQLVLWALLNKDFAMRKCNF